MPAIVVLVSGVVLNVIRWRQGKETACQFTRAHVPKAAAIGGVAWFFLWFPRHLISGYPAKSGSRYPEATTAL